jgi:hypothetical protein
MWEFKRVQHHSPPPAVYLFQFNRKCNRIPLQSHIAVPTCMQALKQVLPGSPGKHLRPYLPSVTKKAWHMDKESLKRGRKQKLKPSDE